MMVIDVIKAASSPFAMLMVTIITCAALSYGFEWGVFAFGVTAVTGLGGYEVRSYNQLKKNGCIKSS
jgi:hypothetical protein